MSRLRFGAGALILGAAFTITALGASPALAHTEKDSNGYKLTFGWQHEPAYVGVQNAVQVFVKDAGGTAIDDLGTKGLTVAVTTQGTTSPALPLLPGFDPDTGLGVHGEFDAALLPTQPGTYTFHISGDINGKAVDVSATSSDTTFNNVADPTSVEFPAKTPTVQVLTQAVNNLQSNLRTANSATSAAKTSANTAKTVAIVGIVVALIAVVAALATGRRRKAPGTT